MQLGEEQEIRKGGIVLYIVAAVSKNHQGYMQVVY